MSRRIFRDVEEALAREVRRITTHDCRTTTRTVLQDTFCPFTGDIISQPIEPKFYDSSSDAGIREYPDVFIKLLKTREDRFTKRIVSQWGRTNLIPVATGQAALNIITGSSDAAITASSFITTNLFNISKVTTCHVLRLLDGCNVGTYNISAVTLDACCGCHTITVCGCIVTCLPSLLFDTCVTTTRCVIFECVLDLNTVKVCDCFVDTCCTSFSITAICITSSTITIGGCGSPALGSGGAITRCGNIFVVDCCVVRFTVLDPCDPVSAGGSCCTTDKFNQISSAIPIDAFYLVRIDSKDRNNHVDILNRVWEEFNPPRTGLPVIIRECNSGETTLSADVSCGGSKTLTVTSNADFNLDDPVLIFNDLLPTKNTANESFSCAFSTTVTGKTGTTTLTVKDSVSDTFKASDNTRIVSNATQCLLMFHFVDHVTRDVESAQYWVHEFTFWTQIFIDRLADDDIGTVVTEIDTTMEDICGSSFED